MSDAVTHYPIDHLHRFTAKVFQHFGVTEEDSKTAADVLATADLRGIDTHGMQRLHTYFDMLTLGRINPKAKPRIVRETASTATVDGDNGLGLVVGPWANRVAQRKAAEAGSGSVSVCHTNHFGACAYYLLDTIRNKDLIAFASTNSTKLVAPLGGAQRMLGTNPLSYGFPAGDEPDLIVDLATSAAAYGKVEMARRKRQPVPEGWIIDKEGRPSTQPDDMVNGGALLPLGSTKDMGGHKGYCLAVAADMLCCVLSGANWGPFAPPFALRQEVPARSVGKGIGHFFGAWRIDGFIDPDEFRRQVDDYIRTFRATKPAPGVDAVLLPGDPERFAQAQRVKTGVPLIPSIVDDMRDIAQRTGIPFD